MGQVDFNHAVLHVRRAKNGTPATHPIIIDEMRARSDALTTRTRAPRFLLPLKARSQTF
jgi:hypothetical protein